MSVGTDESATDGAQTIVLERSIPALAEQLPKLASGPHTLTVPAAECRAEARELLQYFQAVGSFLFGLREVDWASATEEWIPENEHEETLLNVFSFKVDQVDWPEDDGLGYPASLQTLCRHYTKWSELRVPLTLFQEGRNAFRTRHFLTAFIYLYLFIEGMYARGKTGNAQVKKAFHGSSFLRRSAEQFISEVGRPELNLHSQPLDLLLTEFGHDRTAEGILSLAVDLRGSLFHYNRRTPRRKPDPTRTREHFTPAFMLLSLATLSTTLELPRLLVPSRADSE